MGAAGRKRLQDEDDSVDEKVQDALDGFNPSGPAKLKKKITKVEDSELVMGGDDEKPTRVRTNKTNFGDDVFGGNPDASDNEHIETGINEVCAPIKADFEELKRKIEDKENEILRLEGEFYKRTSAKAMELEGINNELDEEIDRHKHLYEMKMLAKLEARLRRVEAEKIALLQEEQRATIALRNEAWVHGEELGEYESRFEAEARKREVTLTKLYSRFNTLVKAQIINAEGNLKAQ